MPLLWPSCACACHLLSSFNRLQLMMVHSVIYLDIAAVMAKVCDLKSGHVSLHIAKKPVACAGWPAFHVSLFCMYVM